MLKKLQFLLILFVVQFVTGQSAPVQITSQVIPPAPIYFADYANKNISNSPLRVQLLLRDITLSNIGVRLKVSFSGNGINFQSNENVVGAQPLFLDGGNPLVLQSVDLAPYFEYQNITGIAPNIYGTELSEGSYEICFEVFEALTNRRLSQKSCVTTYIFKNNPPILIAPANQSNVTERDPQNIVFQWTPRSINVSNVEYELSLVEVWDRQVDPQTAFLTTPPVFQVTTSATSFVYDSSQALLLPDKKYAWRIQAKAKQGTENIGLFKNRGYSEIFSFSYATPCEPPSAITGEPKGANQANISWEDIDTNIPTFKVRYRKQGNTKWFFAQTTSNWLTLWDLKPNTTYEYQISKICSVFDSEWSLLKTVKTQTESDANDIKQCGIPPNINLDNVEPLPSIKVNDGFKAGDFDVKILEVTGSNGRFTGKGFIRVPYLNSIKVGVEFTNILINTNKQLAEGMVITTYDITAGNIVDIDEAIETVSGVVDAVGEVFEGENDLKDIKVNYVINSTEDIKVVNGQIIITNPETGETKTYPANDDTVITDKAGNTYHIDEETGKVTKGGEIDYVNGSPVSAESGNMVGVQRNGDVEKLTAPNIVTFKSANGPYGFDKIPEQAKQYLSKQYETVKDTYGEDYTLIHQAVAKGATTKIIANIDVKNSEYKAKDIIFKTKQGEKLEAKVKSEKEIEVTLTGRYSFEHETIYAVVNSKADNTKQLTAGAFTLWHLTPRTVKVNIVPVGNPSISDADIKTVENIFAKGIANVSPQILASVALDEGVLGDDKELEIGDSAWLTAYNQEQKNVIANLKGQINNFDDNAYYVFVFDESTKTTKDIAGFMPLQRQFGFVFAGKANADEEGKNSLGGVLAHELGHGIFALQHPFTKYKTPKGDTDWLMDYGDGTALSHLDWKQIHDPALKFYIFQKEEDGELGGETWFTPDWKPISVDNSSVIVSTSLSSKIKGTLPGFRKKGVRYTALFDTAGEFVGYYEGGKTSGKKFEVSSRNDIKPSDKVFLFVRSEDDSCNKAYETTYSYAISKKTSISYNDDNTSIKNSGRIKCYDCDEGKKFIDAYKNINDSETQEVIKNISKLICDTNADQSFFNEFAKKGYDNLFAWQKEFYDNGDGSTDVKAFEAFYDAYSNYIEYYKKVKDVIKDTDDKETLLKICYNLNQNQLKTLNVEDKLKMLKVFATGVMGGYWTSSSFNIEALALKIIKSVDKQGEQSHIDLFLEGLLDEKYKIGDKLLFENLFTKIDDYFGDDNFSELIVRLTQLAQKGSNSSNKSKINIQWGARNESFVLNYVVSDTDFEFDFEGKNVYVTGECLKKRYTQTRTSSVETGCEEYKYDKEALHPFNDFVTLTILETTNILPTYMCGNPNVQWCGKAIKVPAVFLPYLQQKKSTQSFENWGINTIVVVGTVMSFGEVAAARAAGQVAYWAIADLTYTFSDPVVSLIYEKLDDKTDNDEFKDVLKNGWGYLGKIFLVKSAADITGLSKLQLAKSYSAIKRFGEDEFYKIFEQSLREAGKEMAEEQIKAMSKDVRKTMNKLGDELPSNDLAKADEYLDGIGATANTTTNLAVSFPKIANRTGALSKIEDIISSGRIPREKLVDAIKGDLGDILNAADDTQLGNILNRLNLEDATSKHLDELTKRLGNNKYKIKQDLIDNPSAFDDFDEMVKDPGKFWEKYNQGDFEAGSNLEKWAKWKWFKDLGEKSSLFERGIAFSRFKQMHNLTDNQVVREVTLLINGNKRIRIDYLGFDKITGKYYLGEAKFTTKDKNWATDWYNASTKNQKPTFKLFEENKVTSIEVRVSDPKKKSEVLENLELNNGDSITFENTELHIIGSNNNAQSIKEVVKIK